MQQTGGMGAYDTYMNRHASLLTIALALLLASAPAARAAIPTTAPVSAVLNVNALPPGQQAVLAVVADIPDGLHSQSATPTETYYIPFKVTVEEHPSIQVSTPLYPPGEVHTYEMLGTLSVYTGQVIAYVPLEVAQDAKPGPVTLTVEVQYQLCDDKACYQPQRPKIGIQTTIAAPGTPVEPNRPELFENYKPGETVVAATQAVAATQPAPTTAPVVQASGGLRSEWTIWTAFGAALLAGLLFNIMPCVLPVLPLKAAAFHRAAEHHRGRSILLGTAFSLGIISVFGILGILVLVMQVIEWGSLFANPYFVWPLVALLVLCALGMFDMFTVQLPASLYGVDPRQDTFGGNVVFGAFTAILATPCTAPLLPGLLLWASAQPAYVGVPAMLLVGVGMALPYFILSATPELAKRFPRTGPWPELFKQMMGFMLLAVAVYFAAGRLIHGPEFWWLVVAVIAIAALYLVARTVQLSPNARPLGISATIAVIMLGGSIWWAARMTGFGAAPVVIAGGNGAATFTTYTDEEFRALRESGKPVLVKFTANWCATCQYIEGTVFRDAKVWSAIQQYQVVPLKVDLTDEDVAGKDLLLRLNPAGGIPLTAIYFPGQAEPVVLASVYNSEELLAALDQAGNGKASASAKATASLK